METTRVKLSANSSIYNYFIIIICTILCEELADGYLYCM